MNSFESRGRHVLVFCVSSGRCDPVFHAAAAALGRSIARAGHTLVDGGGAVGSMGALADAALAEGGSVIGIIPRFMHEFEWAHPALSELRLVDDMQQRKCEMLLTADAQLGMWPSVETIDEVLPAIEQAADWPEDAVRFATR